MTTTFTASGSEAAEAHVRRDLDRIVDAVRTEAAEDFLLAVILLGGYARGEGVVVMGGDGALHGFNDYDLLLLFRSPPPKADRFATLSRRLAKELGIDFVDLGLATPADLAAAPPTLFWYELGEAHRILWSRPGTEIVIPRFAVRDLDPGEGSRLLLNRGMALLWAGLRLWAEGSPGTGKVTDNAEELRFVGIACHKAVLAAGDAALLRAGAYSPHQEERTATLANRPELWSWAETGFLDAYRMAVAFRRQPVLPGAESAVRLWWNARRHHEAGFRAAEEVRLAARLPEWQDHRRRLRSEMRKGWLVPRRAWKRLRRLARERGRAVPEEKFLLELPRLLHEPFSAGKPVTRLDGPVWRREAMTLIREWHL